MRNRLTVQTHIGEGFFKLFFKYVKLKFRNSEAKQPLEALIKRVLCCDCTWQWRVFCNAVSDAESTKQASTGCAGACTRMQRGSITAGATAASLGRKAK